MHVRPHAQLQQSPIFARSPQGCKFANWGNLSTLALAVSTVAHSACGVTAVRGLTVYTSIYCSLPSSVSARDCHCRCGCFIYRDATRSGPAAQDRCCW